MPLPHRWLRLAIGYVSAGVIRAGGSSHDHADLAALTDGAPIDEPQSLHLASFGRWNDDRRGACQG